MWLLLALSLDLAQIKNEARLDARCEAGCMAVGYQSGAYAKSKRKCVCSDDFELADLYAPALTVRSVPPQY